MGRLNLISAQDALLILRAAYGSPKVLNVLRSAPCVDHPALTRFDTLLRGAISSITNSALDEVAWVQASLPIRGGGGGLGDPECGGACLVCLPGFCWQPLPTFRQPFWARIG